MINQEKIRLMTRLAILEKQHGKQIRKAENAFRIDLLTNPVWKMGFFVSLLFAAAAGILMLLNINMFLDAFASGQLKALIMAVLIIYGSLLLITVILTAIRSGRSCRKAVYYQEQYRSLLEKIQSSTGVFLRGSIRWSLIPEEVLHVTLPIRMTGKTNSRRRSAAAEEAALIRITGICRRWNSRTTNISTT